MKATEKNSSRFCISEPCTLIEDKDMPFTFDGTLCTLEQPDGRVRVWETDLGTKPFYFIFEGPKENPLSERVGTFSWDYNGYSDRWPDGLWVQSFYQVSPEDTDHPAAKNGDLLVGFIHREQFSDPFDENGNLAHGHGDHNSYHIGFGISFDRGLNWFYCGDAVSNVLNDQKVLANMGGVPFFRQNDEFCFFFNEYPSDEEGPEGSGKYPHGAFLSCARCKVRETVAALIRHELPAVKKYSGNGKWDTDPMTGTGSPVLDAPYTHFDAHADACYCRTAGLFLLTAWFHTPSRLCLFSSADGEHWTLEGLLYEEDTEDYMTPYSTFVAVSGKDSSADSSVVGEEFYVYFPRKGRQNYGYDEWKRVTVTYQKK